MDYTQEKAELRKQLDDPKADIDAIEKRIKEIEEAESEEKRKAAIAAKLNEGAEVPGAKTIANETRKENVKMKDSNIFESMEYRKAFMKFMTTGEMPAEFRDVAMTADNTAVIPVPTMNEIIDKLDNYGELIPLVRHIAYPAGVVVPTSVTKPTASWLAEGATIAVQDKKTTAVTFGAYEIAAAAGVSLHMQVEALPVFESVLVRNISEAIAKALEAAIVAGDGNGQPTGIMTATVPSSRQKTLSAVPEFSDIIAIEKAIPKAYKQGAVYLMNENTFLDFIGMTDKNGQPVARVNFGTDFAPAGTRLLFGRRVVCTDEIADLDTASAGGIVGAVLNPQSYVLNTSLGLQMRQYVEDTTLKKVWQAYGMYDGKMVDTNGLVFLKKASA